MLRRSALIAAVTAAVLALTACGGDPLAEQYRSGSNKGYIAGDGAIETFSEGSRTAPVEFDAETDTGNRISSTELIGDVLVLNFWYASCPPCRAEARDLEALNRRFSSDDVRFLGVNTRDEASTAQAFAQTFGLTYPSILDYRTAEVQLALSDAVPPNAVPTTLVFDREGRVAARILGQVTEPSTLAAIIEDTLSEGSVP